MIIDANKRFFETELEAQTARDELNFYQIDRKGLLYSAGAALAFLNMPSK